MAQQFDGHICSCVSYRCSQFSTRGRSGNLVPGRIVSPSELRLHTEQDRIASALRDDPEVSQPAGSCRAHDLMNPPSHWHESRPRLEAVREGPPDPPTFVTHNACMTFSRITAIRADLAARMAYWQAQPSFTPFSTGHDSVSFPLSSDLDWLRLTLKEIRETGAGREERCITLREQVIHMTETQIAYLEQRKLQWESQFLGNSVPKVVQPAPSNPMFGWPVPVIAAVVVFLAVLETTFHLSHRGLNFVVAFIKLLVEHLAATEAPLSPEMTEIRTAFSRLPSEITTIQAKARLEPTFIIFASCPSCCHLHRPLSTTGGTLPIYPPSCVNEITKNHRTHVCGAQLLKESARHVPDNSNGKIYVPVRPFAYANVVGYISNLLQSPTHEDAIGRASERFMSCGPSDESPGGCDRPTHSPEIRSPVDSSPASSVALHDILDGSACLSAFTAAPVPTSSRPLLRLIFSLSVDWFRPRGSAQRGSGSIGLISLACLNLPPQIRYLPENVHLLGVTPGPKGEEIQPYLVPLVDEFLVLWNGYDVSSSSLMEQGRSVQAALIPVICDMPAARKVIGFVPPKATMACPFCKCTYEGLSRRSAIDNTVESRTWQEWLVHAYDYRDARTDSERAAYKQRNGVAWSELLRLPYWDPTKFTVVDPMHNLFLGLIEYHVRRVWRIEEATKPTKPPKLRKRVKKLVPPQLRKLVNAKKMLQPSAIQAATTLLENTRDPRRWEKLQHISTIPLLEYLCAARKLKVQVRGRKLKALYIDALRQWDCGEKTTQAQTSRPVPQSSAAPTSASIAVASRPIPTQNEQHPSESDPSPPTTETDCYALLPEELTQIREIIQHISTPSWLGRVASDFGSPSHGTPKSDEWRTAGTIHLPLALITMWAGTSRQQDLEWFLNLATAIQLATRRSTSEARAEEYRSHMRRYLHGLRERGFKLRPNHHAALHLADCLPRFGPARGWWTFPVERQVGLLQKFNTNDRFGELEHTIMGSYHRAAQLRTLVSQPPPKTAPVLQATLGLAKTAFPVAGAGSLATDTPTEAEAQCPRVDYKKAKRLDPKEYALLQTLLGSAGETPTLNPKAQELKRLQYRGVSFATQAASFDDSNILFKRQDGRIGAGRIANIFVHERRHQNVRVSETFAVLERFVRVESAEQAPFKFVHSSNHAQLYLSHTRPDGTMWAGEQMIIRFSSIICHAATLVFIDKDGRERLLTWGLDRS